MIANILKGVCYSNPEHVAIIDGPMSFTYRQLFLLKELLARHLITDLRINKGDRIVLFLRNSVEFIVSFFANVQIGAVSIPLNTHLKERELLSFTERFGISAVITTEDLATRCACMGRHIGKERIMMADKLGEHVGDDMDILAPVVETEPDRFYRETLDSDVLWLSTSGSTGKPRLVPRSESNVIENAKNVEKALHITAKDRFLSVVPFFHANGFSNCMFLPVSRGATVIVMKQFSARKMVKLIQRKKATIVFGSPFIFSVLSQVIDKGCIFPSVRCYLTTGAPMPGGLRSRFRTKVGKDIRQLYGSTETGTISIQMEDPRDNEHTLGKPLKNVEVKIVSGKGTEVSPMETGEIVVKSPALMKGYVKEPEFNKEVFYEGFFRTGDLGMLDQDGNICISGRKRRIVNAAGVKIDPVEVENVLVSYDKVKEAFVYSVINKRGMEIIKAVLVAQSDCKVSEVITHCKERLADFKIPRIVEFKREIPKNLLGKVLHDHVEEE